MDGKVLHVGDIRVAIEFPAEAEAPAHLFICVFALALDLPFQLIPVVVDQHVVLDVLAAGTDEVTGITQIGASALFSGTHQFRDIAKENGGGPWLLEPGRDGFEHIDAAAADLTLFVKSGRVFLQIGA